LLRPLTLIIKYYLKQHYLNDTWTGGIGSYTLVILIISYLQMRPKPLQDQEDENLGKLLIGFFEFYGRKFDYIEHVISVTEGGKYYKKKNRKWYNENNPELLSVEDPYNPEIDVGSASFKIALARQIFDEAYRKLSNLKSFNHSYLAQVFFVSDVVQHFHAYKPHYNSHYNNRNFYSDRSDLRKRKREQRFNLRDSQQFPCLAVSSSSSEKPSMGSSTCGIEECK